MSGQHSTYEPKTGFTRWLDSRLPIVRLAWDSMIDFPTPKNLNYWWTFGGILAMCLGIQIATGVVLAMHYVASGELAANGAKVLQGKAAELARASFVTIRVRPAFAEDAGTVIAAN